MRPANPHYAWDPVLSPGQCLGLPGGVAPYDAGLRRSQRRLEFLHNCGGRVTASVRMRATSSRHSALPPLPALPESRVEKMRLARVQDEAQRRGHEDNGSRGKHEAQDAQVASSSPFVAGEAQRRGHEAELAEGGLPEKAQQRGQGQGSRGGPDSCNGNRPILCRHGEGDSRAKGAPT